MKVYITRSALSAGIYEIGVKDLGLGTVKSLGNYPRLFHGEGKDWHKTRESALKRAEIMRLHKIKSLRSQLEKLEKMEFKK